jgi:pyruvate,water dikinase
MSIFWLDEQACQNAEVCGGKAAALSRLSAHYAVPPGFCATPQSGSDLIIHAYEILSKKLRVTEVAAAVRSSATGEDGRQLSFAGQYATYLNVTGANTVLAAVKHCFASAASGRVAAYRAKFEQAVQPPVSVLVQQFIPAECAAVAFSVNPVNGKRDEIIINAHWGLGESIVASRATPDTYVFSKTENRVIRRQIGAKSTLMRPTPNGNGIIEIRAPAAMTAAAALNEAQMLAVARLALDLERRCGYPVDIECAWRNEELYLLQCRPVTAL